MALRTTIDAAGRVVIPKALRKRYGLEAGRPVQIIPPPDGVSIVPEQRQRRFVRHGPILAIDTAGETARLEDFDIDRQRDERLRSAEP